MAMLSMIGMFLGIFFIPAMGKLIDKIGYRLMMFGEGFAFIFVYVMFGIFAEGLASGSIAAVGIPVLIIYALFIFDRMTMQLRIIRVLCLRDIALDKSEISPTLSTGMAVDHVISIIGAFLGGIVWQAWGPQYVFYIAAFLSLGNVAVAFFLPKRSKP